MGFANLREDALLWISAFIILRCSSQSQLLRGVLEGHKDSWTKSMYLTTFVHQHEYQLRCTEFVHRPVPNSDTDAGTDASSEERPPATEVGVLYVYSIPLFMHDSDGDAPTSVRMKANL